ncbi:MAG: hypothetical protein JWL86_3668 [Rhizobium sp.]|nr:hypothetical protein [Rhizobium sp.]
MSNGTGTWLILLFVLVAFPIFFTILWVGITLLMSFIGGWGKVAKQYPASERPKGGVVLPRVTGMFGVARYKFVLTVITTDTGLYIENRKVFRLGHHPLFIPFSAIHNARKQTLFFWEYVAFDVDDLASVRLPSKVFAGTPVVIAT